MRDHPSASLRAGLDSASVTLDASGAIVANGEQRYYPFGESRIEAAALPTDRLFQSQRDVGLGLLHFGARFYHPRLGRFISADTLVPNFADPQALNRYAFVLNNPLKYIDPTGHAGVEAGRACYGQGPIVGSEISAADCYAWGRDKWILGLPVTDPEPGAGYSSLLAIAEVIKDTIQDSLEAFAWLSEYAAFYAGNDTATYMRYMTMAITGWDPLTWEGTLWDLRGGLPTNVDDWLEQYFFEGQGSWRDDYDDTSDNQMYHFWFYIALTYYYGEGVAIMGNLVHERPAKRQYQDWGMLGLFGDDLIESNPVTASIFNSDLDGVSQQDLYLGFAAIPLGQALKNRTISPYDVDDWLRVNLGDE